MRREGSRRQTIGINPDASEIQGDYVDREDYTAATVYNTEQVALYRYFLEPLGVSVDKWSMGVRGRSRTYTFADVFIGGGTRYIPQLHSLIEADLTANPITGLTGYTFSEPFPFVNTSLGSLPG